jgi:hypothetical protein
MQQSAKDPTFTAKGSFADKPYFIRAGITNIHNEHLWSDENPHAIRFHHQQRHFSVNLYTGILGDCVLGHNILPAKVNGRDYLNFLRTHLGALMEDTPFNRRLHLYFQYDGAIPHFSQ